VKLSEIEKNQGASMAGAGSYLIVSHFLYAISFSPHVRRHAFFLDNMVVAGWKLSNLRYETS